MGTSRAWAVPPGGRTQVRHADVDAAALTGVVVLGRSWLMTRALSTPPVISSGSLSGFPQPVLPAAPGLLLRPWEPADVPAFLSAYADGEIRRWHTRRPRTEAGVQE